MWCIRFVNMEEVHIYNICIYKCSMSTQDYLVKSCLEVLCFLFWFLGFNCQNDGNTSDQCKSDKLFYDQN